MKAAVIKGYGEAEKVFEYVENFAKPQLGRDEVLVRVMATSVNPIDCRIRNGYGQRVFRKKRGFEFPLVMGSDTSGTVEQVGAGVRHVQRGDAVFAAPNVDGQGSYGEYRVLKAEYCVEKPAQLSFLEAASIPYVAGTAWAALVEKAGLNAGSARGKKVLVHGGSGGVGSFAVQLLKSWGAYVATTCSTAKVEWLRQLGADQVIDYQLQDFTKELCDFDVVLDTVGGKNEARSLQVLATHRNLDSQSGICSQYVSIITPVLGNIDQHGFVVGGIRSIATLIRKKRQCKKQGIGYHWAMYKANTQALEEVKALIEQGKIKPVIDKVYPLSQIAEAHCYVESGKACGKVVIEI
ncbi:MAG: NADP-dependent oxidoreductase [Gammaproteobacteria bacterium]|nr:MAG: NADP-dependent oxidoreductase [Gammaproteobacteria bacterium]